jgi:hypothetical protein
VKRNAPVVITRKSKRLGLGHLVAFTLTGGTSGVYSMTKAATNAGYNARTRKLQAASEAPSRRVVRINARTSRMAARAIHPTVAADKQRSRVAAAAWQDPTR